MSNSMYIAVIRNRNSKPCILVRSSYREGGKVKHRKLANITNWPADMIEVLRGVLEARRKNKGRVPLEVMDKEIKVSNAKPYGHIELVVRAMERLEMKELLGSKASRERSLSMVLIAATVLFPKSKLAMSRLLEDRQSELLEAFGIKGAINENDLYAALDWLLSRQKQVEKKLAKRHLKDGVMVLYDLSSSYVEGKTCPLAKRGYSRDKKKGKLQIEYGLLCDGQGVPVAMEVFAGNTSDTATLGAQVEKLKKEFSLDHLVLVGDRGMITQKRIEEDLRPLGVLDWITALRSCQIAQLIKEGYIIASDFDEKNLAEISSPDYPGERLIVCRNPALAKERTRKREELLLATEAALKKIKPFSKEKEGDIGQRIGSIINKYKMKKHFLIDIKDGSFSFSRNVESIASEQALDGFYVVRTSCGESAFGQAHQIVKNYKDLSHVEDAFRCLKSADLRIRPIRHRSEKRVRSHFFLASLAYYVHYHLRKVLEPFLFSDPDTQIPRLDVVSPKLPSPAKKAKTSRKRNSANDPYHSFDTLLDSLSSLCRVSLSFKDSPAWRQSSAPTPFQQKVLNASNSISFLTKKIL